MLAFVSITHSITIFPAPFITAIEMLSLCTSIPIYFLLSIEGVPFCRGCGKHPNPTPKGASFYIALRYLTSLTMLTPSSSFLRALLSFHLQYFFSFFFFLFLPSLHRPP